MKKMPTDKVLKGKGYKCITLIGEGNFSKVMLATSHKHHRHVAIKIIDRQKATEDFLQKFLPREQDILRRVRHDNIVQLLEVIAVGNKRLYIVMEAAAKDLLQKINELNSIPEDQAKVWFSQMVGGIHYLHQNNIAHRDLKCENILLTADEKVKIADFGFARIVEDHTELSRTYCGSAPYTAPEVIMNLPYHPVKADVWSLGVVLFVMVTGSMPYNDRNVRAIPRAQRRPLVYPDNAHVEESCREFIATILQFDPSKRPNITQVQEHPWLQVENTS